MQVISKSSQQAIGQIKDILENEEYKTEATRVGVGEQAEYTVKLTSVDSTQEDFLVTLDYKNFTELFEVLKAVYKPIRKPRKTVSKEPKPKPATKKK